MAELGADRITPDSYERGGTSYGVTWLKERFYNDAPSFAIHGAMALSVCLRTSPYSPAEGVDVMVFGQPSFEFMEDLITAMASSDHAGSQQLLMGFGEVTGTSAAAMGDLLGEYAAGQIAYRASLTPTLDREQKISRGRFNKVTADLQKVTWQLLTKVFEVETNKLSMKHENGDTSWRDEALFETFLSPFYEEPWRTKLPTAASSGLGLQAGMRLRLEARFLHPDLLPDVTTLQ